MLVWPRQADSANATFAAYAALERADIPALVVGWLEPQGARAQLEPGGYVLDLSGAGGVGPISISGNRDAALLPAVGMHWEQNGVSYVLRGAADPVALRARVLPVRDAELQLQGTPWDTPLLYAVVLPLYMLGTWWLVLRAFRR